MAALIPWEAGARPVATRRRVSRFGDVSWVPLLVRCMVGNTDTAK
jgi:hypothetical protein